METEDQLRALEFSIAKGKNLQQHIDEVSCYREQQIKLESEVNSLRKEQVYLQYIFQKE